MITRRKSMQALGAASALGIMPFFSKTEAATTEAPREVSADLLALRDKVKAIVNRFDPQPYLATAQWKQIFTRKRSTQGTELYTKVRFGASAEKVGQRFAWQVKNTSVGLGLKVTPASDLDELRTSLLPSLTKSIKEYQEVAAAEVFHNAELIVRGDGDGQPMCSREHPCFDGGSWSNRMRTDGDLNWETLHEALGQIRTTFVDDSGLRIRANGTRLIVSTANAERAQKAMAELDKRGSLAWLYPRLNPEPFVWDYLAAEHWWFVLTDIEGLIRQDYKHFALKVEIEDDHLVVVGEEDGAFACIDPRAVYASLPNA